MARLNISPSGTAKLYKSVDGGNTLTQVGTVITDSDLTVVSVTGSAPGKNRYGIGYNSNASRVQFYTINNNVATLWGYVEITKS